VLRRAVEHLGLGANGHLVLGHLYILERDFRMEGRLG
jgi:hypothetical protein